MQLSYEYLAVLAVVGASLCHVTYEWSMNSHTPRIVDCGDD